MKNLKRCVLLLLSASIVMSVTACGNNGGDTNQTTAATTTAETTINDDIDNPVDINDVKLDFGGGDNNIEPCELTYMGNYDMTTAGDIKPSVKYLEETFGCTIKVEVVAFNSMEDTILTRIQGGNSPDLIDKQDNTYPHGMSKNMFTALDEYMDMSAPQWSGLTDYIDRYAWNGNHYYYPWSYDVNPYWVVYNRGLFEEEGIDDPYTLYREGNWNWNTFKRCMTDFVGENSERLGFYGYFATAFINSAGATLIDVDEEGRLVNNLKSVEVERVQNFLQELRKEGLGNHNQGMYQNVDINPVTEGTAAFQTIGGWAITNYAKAMLKAEKAGSEMDIFFVPIPKDPEATDYYYSLSTFGYLVPTGSKHVEAACMFINTCRLSVTDPTLKAVTDESIMKNKKYTEEMYSFMQEFKEVENFDHLIIDESFGFPTDEVVIMKDLCLNVAFDQTEEQQSWTQMRDANYDIIQARIDYYNAYITA